MKRTILAMVIVGFFSTLAQAATLQVEIPDALIDPHGNNACSMVKVAYRLPDSTSLSDCGRVMFYEAFRKYLREYRREFRRLQAQTNLEGDMSTIDGVLTFPVTQAVCGDSTIDTHLGEECDDGNTTSGDGCSAECRNE
jgi:cysteine-rich repeat protein